MVRLEGAYICLMQNDDSLRREEVCSVSDWWVTRVQCSGSSWLGPVTEMSVGHRHTLTFLLSDSFDKVVFSARPRRPWPPSCCPSLKGGTLL